MQKKISNYPVDKFTRAGYTLIRIENKGRSIHMKKKSLVILSVFIMIISISLLINKSSYASGASTSTNYCPETVTLKQTNTLEFIPGLPLSNIEVTGTNGEALNNIAIQYTRDMEILENQVLEKIVENPAPIPKFSDNKEENRYYSQLFSWWMDDINFQLNNLTEEEKELIKNSPNGKKIAEKIAEYERYSNWWNSDDYSTPVLDDINTDNITYYVTDDYIETSLIIPDCTKDYSYMFTDYQVNVPSPITVVDKDGNNKTEFQRGEGFKLRVPLSEVKNGTMNFQAKIIGNSTFDIWASYAYSKSGKTTKIVQPVVMINCGESSTETNFETIELNYTEQVGNLNIKVIDAETKENLSNAEIAIYDSLGNIVYRINTTNSEINVTLPIGDYTVKQTVTPENYQPVVIQKRVSVTENETTKAVLENIQLIEVPDLGQRVKGILTMIGGIAVIIGGFIIGMNLIKKKN